MINRIDHCGNLIHFTKGKNVTGDYESAYQTLKKIVEDRMLIAGNGMILGKHLCVCFTESPARCLTNEGKLNPKYFSRYTPFGIQFTKREIYNFTGRPVIYSSKKEYEKERENNNLNWRFVSYDPNSDGKLDFTWEREWRVNTTSIPIDPATAKLVFPNKEWVDRFITEHEKKYHGVDIEDNCTECYCTRDATTYNFTDFLTEESCEILTGTCPDPKKFPWLLINMNEDSK